MSLKFYARATGYTTENTAQEGGPLDCQGNPLQTLAQFDNGSVEWVSVAMDAALDKMLPYGTNLRLYLYAFRDPVPARRVDHGSAFKDQSFLRLDICAGKTQREANDPRVNQYVMVVAPDVDL